MLRHLGPAGKGNQGARRSDYGEGNTILHFFPGPRRPKVHSARPAATETLMRVTVPNGDLQRVTVF